MTTNRLEVICSQRESNQTANAEVLLELDPVLRGLVPVLRGLDPVLRGLVRASPLLLPRRGFIVY